MKGHCSAGNEQNSKRLKAETVEDRRFLRKGDEEIGCKFVNINKSDFSYFGSMHCSKSTQRCGVNVIDIL